MVTEQKSNTNDVEIEVHQLCGRSLLITLSETKRNVRGLKEAIQLHTGVMCSRQQLYFLPGNSEATGLNDHEILHGCKVQLCVSTLPEDTVAHVVTKYGSCVNGRRSFPAFDIRN